jgi:hypothetical protein
MPPLGAWVAYLEHYAHVACPINMAVLARICVDVEGQGLSDVSRGPS